MNIFRTRYRIVRDRYAGFEAQFRHWWMPFYVQINLCNTRATVESSKRLIEQHKQGPIVEQVQ